METIARNPPFKKKHTTNLQSIYSRCLLTRKIVLPITFIGKNLDEVIEEYVKNNFEGKCLPQGYIKQGSSKIIKYSSGVINRGTNVTFEIVFECDVCFPVEGMLIQCVVRNVVKAGIRAESASDIPTPVVVFIAKDHHINNQQFNEVQVGDNIRVRVIGQRFELNDKYVSIIGELVKEKDYSQKPKQQTKQPKIVIED